MKNEIMNLLKKHNKESEYLAKYNKGIKFLSMEQKDEPIECCDGTILTKYELKCSFKPEQKYDNNIVKYQFNFYSNGDHGFYFDGTEYSF